MCMKENSPCRIFSALAMFTVLMLLPGAAGSQDQGIDISEMPPQDMLDYGITFGNLQVIKNAIAKGGRLNNGVNVPLCAAIAGANRTEEFNEAISSMTGGNPPSRESYITLIRWMLQNGADPNILPDNISEKPPLLTAVEYRDLEITALLLASKANPNIRNQIENTALHVLGGAPPALALPFEKGPEIAALLISKGAKSTKNEDGLTPLALAKEFLAMIENNESWTSLPFYESLVQNHKKFIEIMAKL